MKIGPRKLRLAHDPNTGNVYVQLYRRVRRPGGRREVIDGRLALRRDALRDLCDALHDYADLLDRNDREAAQ